MSHSVSLCLSFSTCTWGITDTPLQSSLRRMDQSSSMCAAEWGKFCCYIGVNQMELH